MVVVEKERLSNLTITGHHLFQGFSFLNESIFTEDEDNHI